MGCKTCGKTKDIKLNQLNQQRTSFDALREPNVAMFESRIGRFLYFLLLMFVALTPIINLVVAYMFFKAVYGYNVKTKEKSTLTEENAQVNKDNDQAQ